MKKLRFPVQMNRVLSFKQKSFAFLLRRFFPFLFKLWAKTLRIEIIGKERALEEEAKHGANIYTCWHGRLFLSAVTYMHSGVPILVSPSLDGDYAAVFIGQLGFPALRGDDRYGGSQAIRQIVKTLKSNTSIGLMPDGPLGPAYKAKPGAVIAARLSGKKIFPIGNNARWKITLKKSWDQFIIPLPFSKCVYYYSSPITVSSTATKEEIHHLTETLENELQRLDEECCMRLGIPSIHKQVISTVSSRKKED